LAHKALSYTEKMTDVLQISSTQAELTEAKKP
jgi:hypothetical protein